MKKFRFLIFITIVFLIYFAANYYVFTRVFSSLSFAPQWREPIAWAFLLLVLAYPVGRVLERVHYSTFSNIFHWIGAFWLGILLYAFLYALLVDIVSVFMGIPGLTPKIIEEYPGATGFYVFLAGVLIVLGLNVFGHLRAIHPVYKKIQIPINKANTEAKTLRLALISDVHLGTIIGANRFSRIVERINKIDPDAVIIAGDLVDEDIQPVIRKNMGRYLDKLRRPVFAVTGNHEYIGGVERSLSYLKKFNIRYLRDEWLEWNGLVLAGREDRDRYRYTGSSRESLGNLLKEVDPSKPMILIDHQPLELNEKQKNGVDFTISGHTHNGQSWPLNFITNASFQVSYGYALWNNMHVYVSSGVGGWGPPIRIGTRAEIVQMDLEFYRE